jgi:hypothetical protein
MTMQQLRLLSNETVVYKSMQSEHIKARFKKVGERAHEVVLEINSNKFLIQIQAGFQKLEQFEIIAVKGFVEIWVKVVTLLRRIVSSLYFEH